MNNTSCQFETREAEFNQAALYRYDYHYDHHYDHRYDNRYDNHYENRFNHRYGRYDRSGFISSNNPCSSPSVSETDNVKLSLNNSAVKQPDPNIIKQVIDELDPITLLRIQQQISLQIEDLIRPARKVRKSGVPRPQNLFVIFRKDYQARLIKKGHDVGALLSLVSKEASEQWKLVDQSIKDIYDIIANMARKVHERTYPDYVYKPKKRPQKSAFNRAFGPNFFNQHNSYSLYNHSNCYANSCYVNSCANSCTNSCANSCASSYVSNFATPTINFTSFKNIAPPSPSTTSQSSTSPTLDHLPWNYGINSLKKNHADDVALSPLHVLSVPSAENYDKKMCRSFGGPL
ncbi:12610_t:CDS:1 [Dentiscutata erythropus]|uniref:12610_t:CDS:1 n=1 Tax=Dentiscutata erythropus TaxID=1348616 RepID=A0A9N9IBD6_9GLOM|nr:12610_t:CDS:1 [Dentiscutata erythropus]